MNLKAPTNAASMQSIYKQSKSSYASGMNRGQASPPNNAHHYSSNLAVKEETKQRAASMSESKTTGMQMHSKLNGGNSRNNT